MGILDKFKKSGAIDKVTDAIAGNASKVDGGIDKAAGLINTKTKNKHSDKINKAAGAAKKGVDKVEEQAKTAKAKQTK
ncbi:MAG TPA: antitoxin [Iamia sp.]|nr:antitoxin [Iamia sp.]